MIARKNQGVNLGFLFVLDSFALGRVSWAPLAALGASLASKTDSLSRLFRCSSQARKPAPQRGAGGLAAAPRSAFAPRVPRVARRSPPPHSFLSPACFALLALALLLASRACAPWPARAPSPLAPRKPSAPACPRSLPAGGLSLGRFAPGARRGAFVAPRRFPTSPLVVLLSQRLHKRARLNCTGFARPCLLLSL